MKNDEDDNNDNSSPIMEAEEEDDRLASTADDDDADAESRRNNSWATAQCGEGVNWREIIKYKDYLSLLFWWLLVIDYYTRSSNQIHAEIGENSVAFEHVAQGCGRCMVRCVCSILFMDCIIVDTWLLLVINRRVVLI